METKTIETRSHTDRDGRLDLSLQLGVPNTDVHILIRVGSGNTAEVDANGWPIGYFDTVPGSMPELQRPSQGSYEDRLSFE